MTKKNLNKLEVKLARYLGLEVITPNGTMILAEIYANGYCGCVPLGTTESEYSSRLCKFHMGAIGLKP
jgi:hypothetical protein